MIAITIDLVPNGFEPRRRTIATMHVTNVSEGVETYDYRIDAMEAANRLTGKPAGIAECMVARHDRVQSVWVLLKKACEEIEKADFVEL